MAKLNKNDPAAIQTRRERAAAREAQRAERSDAEQLKIILARGASENCREVRRLRGES